MNDSLFLIFRKFSGQPNNSDVPASPTSDCFNDTKKWLSSFGLSYLETHFKRIPIRMVPFIRRSDLIRYLQLPLKDSQDSLNKVWNAIQQLPFNLPPPIDYLDNAVLFLFSIS
jgi:hypothetical protein